MASQNSILGIDIGGTGLKFALVDAENGELQTERFKELTPHPSTPKAVTAVIKKVFKDRFSDYQGIVGVGFPAIVKEGGCLTAANIDSSWVGVNVNKLISDALNLPVYTANDADLAGLAEIHFGHGKDVKGKVIVLTIGTGIGSGFFLDGNLISNTELGHLLYDGESYELYAANSARKREDLKWNEWGKRLNQYLQHVELLFSPDLFILGGGVSKKFHKFEEFLDLRAEVIPAYFQNAAGVLGAAMFAKVEHAKHA